MRTGRDSTRDFREDTTCGAAGSSAPRSRAVSSSRRGLRRTCPRGRRRWVGRGDTRHSNGETRGRKSAAKEHEVYNELLKVKEIVELHPLFGEYDLIAKIEAEDFNVLGQVVVDKIRSIPGVIDTKTLTGIKF